MGQNPDSDVDRCRAVIERRLNGEISSEQMITALNRIGLRHAEVDRFGEVTLRPSTLSVASRALANDELTDEEFRQLRWAD